MAKSVETLHEASWYPLDPEFETEVWNLCDECLEAIHVTTPNKSSTCTTWTRTMFPTIK